MGLQSYISRTAAHRMMASDSRATLHAPLCIVRHGRTRCTPRCRQQPPPQPQQLQQLQPQPQLQPQQPQPTLEQPQATLWQATNPRIPPRPPPLYADSPRARVATVTTLRGLPPAMLTSFVRWHLRLGFCRLYLYFDDPDDVGVALARKLRHEAARRGYGDDCVRVVPCDSRVRGDWGSLHTASRWELSRVRQIVEVRQLLNCEHALRAAHADADVDWLLHIDSDELFWIDDLDAAAHFGRLNAHGCVNFRYAIHEAVPEAVNSRNVFESVTLFRRHATGLEAAVLGSGGSGGAGGGGARSGAGSSGSGGDAASAASAAGAAAVKEAGEEAKDEAKRRAASSLAFWSRALRVYNLGSPQGKSATRVLPGVLPMSVHTFAPPDATHMPKCWAGFPDKQDAIGENARVVSPIGQPAILHYISCCFDLWWDKYRLLGRFALEKPGGEAVGGKIDAAHFHAISRDLVTGDAADVAVARAEYESRVCLLDGDEARRQVESRVCFRLAAVRDELRRPDESGWPGMHHTE